MDLKQKLGLLQSPGPRRVARPSGLRSGPDDGEETVAPPPQDKIEHLRALIGEVVVRDRGRLARSPSHEPAALPVGETRSTEHGEVHVVGRLLEPDHRHGTAAVGAALSARAETVAKLALDPELAAVDLSGMLILDTETTGLAGGTGTLPFLVGVAWFEQGVLRVEQLFLRNFGQERPLLRWLSERLASASCLLSYNGKAFDWPLLRTRFILNRVPVPALPPHLDLLHCARRVLKPRLLNVRLTQVERELLSFHREDDVDGAEIPVRYRNYLRGGDPRLLLPVLEHNVLDLIALAAILGKVSQHFEAVQGGDDPRDHLAYAKLAVRVRDGVRARNFAEAVLCGGAEPSLRLDAWALLGALEGRAGDYAAAEAALHQGLLAARDEREAAPFHFALAKLYEHRLRDLAQAYRHARWTAGAEGPHSQGRRLGRLRRRLMS